MLPFRRTIRSTRSGAFGSLKNKRKISTTAAAMSASGRCAMLCSLRPIFKDHYWKAYREVNQLFAEAVLEEAGDEPALIFIQDYHFALLPRMLKERNPNLVIAQFWHIPWPTQEIFRTLPWGEEMLEGMLGNDLLGFHLRYHSRNFAEAVRLGIEARADQTGFDITRHGHVTRVRAFPISIDFDEESALADSEEVRLEQERWTRDLNLQGKLVGAGIERSDYTKGIPERLRAINRMLEALAGVSRPFGVHSDRGAVSRAD